MQSSQLCNNGLSLFISTELDALLNNIRGEFVFGQSQQLRRDDLYNLGSIFRLPVLDDMLRDIVAVLVGDEH